ncbi:MAG: hypothetical protein ACI92S_004898, partial [Planctomycetaceae bacterium]
RTSTRRQSEQRSRIMKAHRRDCSLENDPAASNNISRWHMISLDG